MTRARHITRPKLNALAKRVMGRQTIIVVKRGGHQSSTWYYAMATNSTMSSSAHVLVEGRSREVAMDKLAREIRALKIKR